MGSANRHSFEFCEIRSANRLRRVRLQVGREWLVEVTAFAKMTGEASFNELEQESDVAT